MPSYTLHQDLSPGQIRRHLRFTTRRAGARSETTSLHLNLAAALSALQAGLDAVEAAHDEALDASANIPPADEVVNTLTSDLVARALWELGRDRQHPSFVAAFPTPPSVATKGVSESQRVYLQNAIDVMSGDPLFVGLASTISTLQTALDSLSALISVRDEKDRLEGLARQQLKPLAHAAVDAFNTAHPTLKLLFPKQKALVNSFFLSERQAKMDPVVG